MRFRNRLFLLILPLVILPTAATTILSIANTRRAFERLEVELLNVKIEQTINHAEEAMETLKRAGIEHVDYYLHQQQQRVIEWMDSLEIADGSVFVLRPGQEHAEPDLVRAVADEDHGSVHYSVQGEAAKASRRIAVFQRFEPWDWQFVAAVDARTIFGPIDRLLLVSIAAAVVAIALTIGFLLLLSRSVARPVKVLSEVTKRVGEGDLAARVEELGKGEFGTLSAFFNGMVGKLETYAKGLESMVATRTSQLQDANGLLSDRNNELENANAMIEEKNERMQQSINIARRIQRSMLPGIDQLRREFGEIFVLYEPKDELSGDFYWSAHLGSQRLLCLADCMGHGVPGALITTIAITQLRRIVLDEGVTDPGEVLTRLHGRLLSSEDDIGGIDMILLRVDREENRGADRVSCALAHRTLSVVSGGRIEEIQGARYPVGSPRAGAEMRFSTVSATIDSGGMVYLVSDGLADQPDPSHRRFGSHRQRELFSQLQELPVEVQRQRVIELIASLDKSRRDDITLVGLRIDGPAS